MFDYHAHIGDITGDAYVCTSSLGEAHSVMAFPHASVGLLPPMEGNAEELEEYASLGLGIGEIGLDRRFPFREQQIERFRTALSIARHYHSLVTIHSVGWLDVTLSLLEEIKPERFIFHSFVSSLEVARRIEKNGGIISFSPVSVRTKHFMNVLENCDSFLIETDMPTGEDERKKLKALYSFIAERKGHLPVFPDIF